MSYDTHLRKKQNDIQQQQKEVSIAVQILCSSFIFHLSAGFDHISVRTTTLELTS